MLLKRLIFAALALFPVYLEATTVNLDDFSLSGRGTSRWTIGNELLPYHAANVLDVFVDYRLPNKEFRLETRFTLENPSVSHGYLEKQIFRNRFTAGFHKENPTPFLNSLDIKTGDLKKLTLGRGLTIKDMEAMGFSIQVETISSWTAALTYVGRGYSEEGDYSILTLEDPGKSLRVMLFTTIADTVTEPDSSIVSLFGDIPLFPAATFSYEIGYLLDAPSGIRAPIGLMISPSYRYQDTNLRINTVATARYYSDSFIAPFAKHALVKTFRAIEEEKEDYDNFRNIVLHQRNSSSKEASTISARVKIEYRLMDDFWGYGDLEGVGEFYDTTSVKTVLYTFGMRYEWTQKQSVFAAIQNKTLNSVIQDIYNMVDSNILRTVDPLLVIGMNYAF